MGNQLCKRKGNDGDTVEVKENAMDRIMSRLCLRPNSWTTDLHRSKQVSRSSKSKLCKDMENTDDKSKSSDWVDCSLEVPDKDFSISFDNSKLEPVFNTSESGTPIPPPRKQKKGIKEKIEAAAKSGLLALQPKKSIEEPLCVKKKINYSCPCHDPKHKHNLENSSAVQEKNIVNKKELKLEKSKKNDKDKESKRRKNLSVVSLPNYSDLKFTVADFSDIDGIGSDSKQIKASHISLPQETKVFGSKSYMVRCRSFGSLLPQQLLDRLKPAPSVVPSAESDDSFAALEDWDLDLIEHYNPRDASLPRPRRTNIPKPEKHILSDIEKQIMKEDIETLPEVKNKSISNSAETLLLSDNLSTNKLPNSASSDPPAETHCFSSLEIYDSIEDAGNEVIKTIDSRNYSEPKTQREDQLINNNMAETTKRKEESLRNAVEQFIESEKKDRIMS